METKYKGYEELLDVDEEDPDIGVPKDLQGSVRALNYALAHPLIFSEPHGTYKERRVKKIKVGRLHSASYEVIKCSDRPTGRVHRLSVECYINRQKFNTFILLLFFFSLNSSEILF